MKQESTFLKLAAHAELVEVATHLQITTAMIFIISLEVV